MQDMQKKWTGSLGREDPLEEVMATHSSILAWEIEWTEQPGGLQFMESQRFEHNRVHADHDQSVRSVTQSCLSRCDPMDCSTPGFLVHHQLPELAQIHVH